MELKHALTNLLPRLSKARLRQFLDHLLQPKVTNVNPFAPRMTNSETVETILSSASIVWTCLQAPYLKTFDNAVWVFLTSRNGSKRRVLQPKTLPAFCGVKPDRS